MEGLILGRHLGAPHLDSSQAVNASSRLGTLERTFAPRVGDWIQKRRDRAFRVIERDERRLPSDPCMRLMAQAIPNATTARRSTSLLRDTRRGRALFLARSIVGRHLTVLRYTDAKEFPFGLSVCFISRR